MPDLEFAHAVLVLECDPVDDAPILDLRLRKGVRRRGVRLAVASARPGALDTNAEAVLRFAPGGGEAVLVGLDAALAGDVGNLGGAATAAGSNATAVRQLAAFLSGAGDDVVILYGERLLAGPRGAAAARGAAQRRLAARARRPRRRGAARDPRLGQRARHPRGRLRRRARPRLRGAWPASRSARRASPRRSPTGS